jgi:hypothetical protein
MTSVASFFIGEVFPNKVVMFLHRSSFQILARGRRISFSNPGGDKRSKLKLYWSVIRPVVTYACETWVLKENVIQKLMMF